MLPFSLKKILKTRLLEEMVGEVRNKKTKDEFMLLVVDSRTSKILSSCSRVFDVMQTDVMIIENLSLCRQKLDFHAIYFIENTTASIKYLMKDYHPRKKPQYQSVHLFFTGPVSDEHMRMIKERKQLVSRIKTFKELHVDFLSFESRVFSFGRPCKTLSNLYLKDDNEDIINKELVKTSEQLVSLCLTLKVDPYVRFWAQSKSSNLCEKLAKSYHELFNQKKEKLTDWKRNENRNRGTLLIVDRSIDPAAPLMHEYTYQAIVNDLLKVDGELCTPPEDEKKKNKIEEKKHNEQKEDGKTEKKEKTPIVQVLSEADRLWDELRHQHISYVMGELDKQIKAFKSENKMALYKQAGKTGETSIKQMVNAVKGMPEYKEAMSKFQRHLDLANACFRLYKSRFLQELGDLEQDMATGLKEDGQDVVVKIVKQALVAKCQSKEIAVMDKMRLLMIYMISQGGIQKGTLTELMKTIDTSLKDALYNLPKLGVDIRPPPKDGSRTKRSKERDAEFQEHAKKSDMILMRYVPYLRSVMAKLISWDLDTSIYPYIEQPPQGSKPPKGPVATTWRKPKKQKEDNRPVYIVFVLGGVTFSEMRLIYSMLDPKVNIIIGSTDILTPERFIRGMADLSEGKCVEAIHNSEGNAASDQDVVAGDDTDIEDNGPEIEEEKDLEPVVTSQAQPEASRLDKCLDSLYCSCFDRILYCPCFD